MATPPPPPSVEDLIARNRAYIPTHTPPQIFVPGKMPPPGTKRTIILTCMDHRVQPQEFLGLKGGMSFLLPFPFFSSPILSSILVHHLPSHSILTFMTLFNDPNISHPEQGLTNIDAVLIRNAGGRARHAIFDIALLDTLVGVAEVVVIHHMNCGLTLTTDDHLRKELATRSANELEKWDMEGVCFTDVAKSVREDVGFLRGHAWLEGKEVRVSGLVYDTEKGTVKLVDF
jgi:carbonic anhydrase